MKTVKGKRVQVVRIFLLDFVRFFLWLSRETCASVSLKVHFNFSKLQMIGRCFASLTIVTSTDHLLSFAFWVWNRCTNAKWHKFINYIKWYFLRAVVVFRRMCDRMQSEKVSLRTVYSINFEIFTYFSFLKFISHLHTRTRRIASLLHSSVFLFDGCFRVILKSLIR